MVRHKYQFEYADFILYCGHAVDGEIQQIIAYCIEDESAVCRALVAVVNHTFVYFSLFHGCKDGKGKPGCQINALQKQ